MDRRPYGHRGRAEKPDLAALAQQWAEASCAAQGVEVKIADVAVLLKVASLLGGSPGAQTRQTGETRVGSK